MPSPAEFREALHVLGITDDDIRDIKQRGVSAAAEYREAAEKYRLDRCRLDAARALLRAAILDAEIPEPLTVGHLASADDKTVKVLAIDGDEVWVRLRDGTTDVWLVQYLTPLGPAPEGWPHA